MNIFEHLRAVSTANIPDDHFLIRALCCFEGYSSIDEFGSVPCPPTKYAFLLTLTHGGLGSCYCEDDIDLPADWVGRDARSLRPANRYLAVSLLDSVHSNLRQPPDDQVQLIGTPWDKAKQRAALIVSEIEALAGCKGITQPHVVNIGALGKCLTLLAARGIQATAVDLNPAIIGQKIGEVPVLGPKHIEKQLGQADIALITGMTVANGTLDAILDQCMRHGTLTVIYAETGASFAPEYCRLGFNVVVSEIFPYYTIPGLSNVKVYRRRADSPPLGLQRHA